MQRALSRLRGADTAQGYKTRRDRVIARRLQETFDRDLELTRVSGLHLFVQNSEVTLYGTVQNELDRELIVAIAGKIPGVKGVIEHLQVAQSSDTAANPSEMPGTEGL